MTNPFSVFPLLGYLSEIFLVFVYSFFHLGFIEFNPLVLSSPCEKSAAVFLAQGN